MNTLPSELIEIIFSKIVLKPDILCVRGICKKWKCYVERFVREIISTSRKLIPTDRLYGNIHRDLLTNGMGEYLRFRPEIFQVLPRLRSILEVKRAETSTEYIRNDIPLIIDDFTKIPMLAEQTSAEGLDVYLVVYPAHMNDEKYYYGAEGHQNKVERVHHIARGFFIACFEFLRRYPRSHDALTFSARCDIPHPRSPCIERVTLRYLRGTMIISGIEVVYEENPIMRIFRDSPFIINELTSIAPHVKGLSTWFLRFAPLWSSDLFPYLTTLQVYRQTYCPKVFSILARCPTIHTLIHTYRRNHQYDEANSLGSQICYHSPELIELFPCLKPVHLILPFHDLSLDLILEKFPNVQSIGLLNRFRWGDGLRNPMSREEILFNIEKIRSHNIQKLRVYTPTPVTELPVFSDLHVEMYPLFDNYLDRTTPS